MLFPLCVAGIMLNEAIACPASLFRLLDAVNNLLFTPSLSVFILSSYFSIYTLFIQFQIKTKINMCFRTFLKSTIHGKIKFVISILLQIYPYLNSSSCIFLNFFFKFFYIYFFLSWHPARDASFLFFQHTYYIFAWLSFV